MMQFYPSGTRIAGRYEVAGRPLQGGMGIVYLCFDHQEQRPVALKTFKPEFLPNREARARFLEEGNVWVRLGKHPHIVRCYAVFVDEPRPDVYLVLELIAKEEGRQNASLRAWLTPGRPLPPDQALLIALQIARGMTHASTVIPGFVHRDLKPENVLVGADRLSNATINRVRVTDFGLVRGLRGALTAGELDASERGSKSGQLTQTGALLGTPGYMAPEQWEDAAVTAQADIYAFGCILGEMVTGHMLVHGKLPRELWRTHQSGAALAAVRDAQPSLRDILGHCLATEPVKRYTDWVAVETALAVAYHTTTGKPAPGPEQAAALSRAGRVSAGWSYNEIGKSYAEMGQGEQAVGYFAATQATGRAEGERKQEAIGLIHLGAAYCELGDAQRAIGYHEQALAILRTIGDRHIEAYGLGDLGIAYGQLGNARQAIRCHEQALAISREIGDRRSEGADLSNLGVIYGQLEDVRRAISYHEQALAVYREISYRRAEGIALGHLGSLYGQLGNTHEAIGYIEQALVIMREIGDRRNVGVNLGNLANCYLQLRDDSRAFSCYEQALAIFREIGDRRSEGISIGSLGNAHAYLGDAHLAIGYFEQALAIFREIGDLDHVSMICFNMAKIYDQQGIPAQALPLAREAAYVATQIGQTALAQRAQQLVTQLEGQ